MITVSVFTNPFNSSTPDVYHANSLAEFLLNHYGDSPDVQIQCFNGEPSAATALNSFDDIIGCETGSYTILQSPAGDPITWFIIGAVIGLASILLMPSISTSGYNQQAKSANNSLADRQNQLRYGDRVEDIYGTVLSIPSLMMPTYKKYKNNIRYEYGYYCVSRGYCDVTDIRDSDTLISEISGASAAVYHPYTSPNKGAPVALIGSQIEDRIITVNRSNTVDGIELKAPNEVKMVAGATYNFVHGIPSTITQVSTQTEAEELVNNGDVIYVNNSSFSVKVITAASVTFTGSTKTITLSSKLTEIYDGETVTVTGTTSNDATYSVTVGTNGGLSFVVEESIIDETAASTTITANSNYDGEYYVTTVDAGVMTFDSTEWNRSATSVAADITVGALDEWTDWVTLNTSDRDRVWCNIVATQGMYKNKGGGNISTSVTLELQIEEMSNGSPTGTVVSVTETLTGRTNDEVAKTIEVATTFVGQCRARMRRTTDYNFAYTGTIADAVRWADLYSVSPVERDDFGDKTTIHTVTRATTRATAIKNRELNCIASRLLPTYNGTEFSTELNQTSRVCDIIHALAVDPKIGGLTTNDIDIDQIYSVQNELDAWNTECGQFNYTFDESNTSFEESVQLVANAAFCSAYRQNGRIRLSLDKKRDNSVMQFTHRHKQPNSERITRIFAERSGYDGVEMKYIDPDTNQEESFTIPTDGSYTKAKTIDIAGIRSFEQAWLRANREYNRILNQRINIETVVTTDARSLLPNSRIDIVDNTRFKSYDGEVIAQSGLTLTLSRDVVFGAGSHSIVLSKRDGTIQGIPCVAGDRPNKVVLQYAPAESIKTTQDEDGIRTIFSFGSDDARDSIAYTVQELDISDKQYVTIRAINYSDRYYDSDYLSIPDKTDIIGLV